ncbi:MAG: aldehyde ferredoxin oxidoreductase family protein [Candidatus Bathyarchaeota archaeon]|nr:MAG: aldehyde ferredoxin oxidoreductase family protein [Candidatus Bathyarchaeota archaeon]
MPYGYNGKTLRVNLTDEIIRTEEPPENWYRTYLGGMGAIAYHILREVPQGVDPLSPGNILLMAPGVISGAPFSGSGRNAVGGLSPLTGGFGEADAGGYWQTELKNAGFDQIIVEGASEKPAWLWIEDGEAEIRDASKLWGLEVAECQDRMREEVGDDQAKTALIGEAGEKLSRLACVINDLNHVAGRSGMGAIMGSKRLKGVAVRGHDPPEVADPERLRALARKIVEQLQSRPFGLSEYGTGAAMHAGVATGNLPTRNFRDGGFEHPSEIDAIAVKNRYRVGMGTCYACAVRCKKKVELEEPYEVEARYGGPEYETLAALGSDCGVADLAAICKGNELCQRYGLDTIGVGATIAFAMECYEEGIITLEMTGDIDLRFGNAEAMVKLVELIGKREGIGDLLAEGTKRAAEKLGNGAEAFAVHVKGQEVPMHEPRLKRALGLGYAVSPTGADHQHNVHDTGLRGRAMERLKAFGVLEPVALESLGGEKVRIYKYVSEMRVLTNCLAICNFVPWDYHQYVELLNAVTGWDTTLNELAKVAQRTLALAKIINLRSGFTAADDWLPPRMFTPQTSGALSETAVIPEELRHAVDLYYEMMGWDPAGVPRTGTLHELAIPWAKEYLPSRGADRLIV